MKGAVRLAIYILGFNMATNLVKQGFQRAKNAPIKPVISKTSEEARRRGLALYKAWYKSIPWIVKRYKVPITEDMCKKKLREQFEAKRHVQDLRARDLLILKGKEELLETMNMHKQILHLMTYFKQTVNPRPTTFLDKFYDGHDP